MFLCTSHRQMPAHVAITSSPAAPAFHVPRRISLSIVTTISSFAFHRHAHFVMRSAIIQSAHMYVTISTKTKRVHSTGAPTILYARPSRPPSFMYQTEHHRRAFMLMSSSSCLFMFMRLHAATGDDSHIFDARHNRNRRCRKMRMTAVIYRQRAKHARCRRSRQHGEYCCCRKMSGVVGAASRHRRPPPRHHYFSWHGTVKMAGRDGRWMPIAVEATKPSPFLSMPYTAPSVSQRPSRSPPRTTKNTCSLTVSNGWRSATMSSCKCSNMSS